MEKIKLPLSVGDIVTVKDIDLTITSIEIYGNPIYISFCCNLSIQGHNGNNGKWMVRTSQVLNVVNDFSFDLNDIDKTVFPKTRTMQNIYLPCFVGDVVFINGVSLHISEVDIYKIPEISQVKNGERPAIMINDNAPLKYLFDCNESDFNCYEQETENKCNKTCPLYIDKVSEKGKHYCERNHQIFFDANDIGKNVILSQTN